MNRTQVQLDNQSVTVTNGLLVTTAMVLSLVKERKYGRVDCKTKSSMFVFSCLFNIFFF